MNPFESFLSSSEQKRRVATEVRRAGFGRAMATEQYSAYHTEGEKVADHYRLAYDAMNAIRNDEDPQYVEKLPVEVREALRELDPSVKRTIKEFPTLMRYVVMVHDIAKQPEGVSINPKNFVLPPDEDSGSLASRYGSYRKRLEDEIASLESRRKDLQAQEKAAKKAPEKLAPIKAEREAVAADIESKKNEIAAATRKAYVDMLASGMGSKRINERYGLGVGFIDHEKNSAEMVRRMDLPEDLKALLAKLTEAHIVPLNAFNDVTVDDKRGRNKDGSFKKTEERACGELFRDMYKGFSDIESRLSTAMVALDLLGSIPKGGKPDLTVINRMIAGKREGFIMDGIEADLQKELRAYLSANHPHLVDKELTNSEDRRVFQEAKVLIEGSLRQKYAEAYDRSLAEAQ